MNTGPEHHLIVSTFLFFVICMACIQRRIFFFPILILLPVLMELVQPFLPFNFSLEIGDIFWNYLGAAIGIVAGEGVGSALGKGAALGAAAGATLGGAKGFASDDARREIVNDLNKKSLENKAIKPGSLAFGFIFFPGEAPSASQ